MITCRGTWIYQVLYKWALLYRLHHYNVYYEFLTAYNIGNVQWKFLQAIIYKQSGSLFIILYSHTITTVNTIMVIISLHLPVMVINVSAYSYMLIHTAGYTINVHYDLSMWVHASLITHVCIHTCTHIQYTYT